jgi:hypothetical protein
MANCLIKIASSGSSELYVLVYPFKSEKAVPFAAQPKKQQTSLKIQYTIILSSALAWWIMKKVKFARAQHRLTS